MLVLFYLYISVATGIEQFSDKTIICSAFEPCFYVQPLKTTNLFLKMGQPGPLFVNFRPFLIPIQYELKKHRCCAWGSNPGPRTCRHQWIHWTITASCIYSFNPLNYFERFYHYPKNGGWNLRFQSHQFLR